MARRDQQDAAKDAPLGAAPGRNRPISSEGGPRSQAAPAEDLAVTVLSVVAEPNRVRLLRLLLDGEHCVTQCTQHTGLVQSLVSKHLGRLVDAGLVQRRRAGRRNYHSVVDAAGVRQLLAIAEQLAVQDDRPAPDAKGGG